MKTAISLSELTSREKLAVITRQFRDEILNGEVNPLEAAIILKAMEDFTKSLRGDILVKDCVKSELDKYPEKAVRFNGCTFTKKAVGTKYDYSLCNDPEHERLKAKADIAASLLKEREDFLKVCPESGHEYIDDKTGEIVKIYPPAKISEEGYSIIYTK
jgi:hypothetical protein